MIITRAQMVMMVTFWVMRLIDIMIVLVMVIALAMVMMMNVCEFGQLI